MRRITEIQRASQKTNCGLCLAAAAVLSMGLAFGWSSITHHQRVRLDPPPSTSTQTPYVHLAADAYKAILRSNQYPLIVGDYRQILKHYPQDAELFQLTAIALINSERFSEAEQVTQEAIELDPTHPDYHYLLCDTRVYQGKLEAAQAAIQRSLECRDAGRPTGIPVDARAAKVRAFMAAEKRMAAGPPPEPALLTRGELEEIAYVCEVTNQLEVAGVCYCQVLAKDPDPTRRSLLRHQLLCGFARKSLQNDDLPADRRNCLAQLVLDWMQDQFQFAASSINDPRATLPSKSLMKCLQANPELTFVRNLPSDERLDKAIRTELRELLVAIDQAQSVPSSLDGSAQ